jgi:hypothetical protein
MADNVGRREYLVGGIPECGFASEEELEAVLLKFGEAT